MVYGDYCMHRSTFTLCTTDCIHSYCTVVSHYWLLGTLPNYELPMRVSCEIVTSDLKPINSFIVSMAPPVYPQESQAGLADPAA